MPVVVLIRSTLSRQSYNICLLREIRNISCILSYLDLCPVKKEIQINVFFSFFSMKRSVVSTLEGSQQGTSNEYHNI